jgi:hypothetical protein
MILKINKNNYINVKFWLATAELIIKKIVRVARRRNLYPL